jgi:hypothetical protein
MTQRRETNTVLAGGGMQGYPGGLVVCGQGAYLFTSKIGGIQSSETTESVPIPSFFSPN